MTFLIEKKCINYVRKKSELIVVIIYSKFEYIIPQYNNYK